MGFNFHLDYSREKAFRSARPFFEENMKMAAPFGLIQGLTDEQIRSLAGPEAASTPGLPTIEIATRDRSWLWGTPEDVIASLKEFEEKYPGLDYVNVMSCVGTPRTVMREQLERFAEEGMPAFLPRSVGPGPPQ